MFWGFRDCAGARLFIGFMLDSLSSPGQIDDGATIGVVDSSCFLAFGCVKPIFDILMCCAQGLLLIALFLLDFYCPWMYTQIMSMGITAGSFMGDPFAVVIQDLDSGSP